MTQPDFWTNFKYQCFLCFWYAAYCTNPKPKSTISQAFLNPKQNNTLSLSTKDCAPYKTLSHRHILMTQPNFQTKFKFKCFPCFCAAYCTNPKPMSTISQAFIIPKQNNSLYFSPLIIKVIGRYSKRQTLPNNGLQAAPTKFRLTAIYSFFQLPLRDVCSNIKTLCSRYVINFHQDIFIHEQQTN